MSTIPRSPVTAATMVAALASAGASPFTPRRALEEMARRRRLALTRSAKGLGRLLFGDSFHLGLPHALEVDDDVFLTLDLATRADLVAAVEVVSRRYLARKEPRHYLLNTLHAAVTFLPLLLDGEMTVGEARLREATP
ncbi:MAG: hypothetical protein KY447_09355 [Actinobacteria bacterium]|nr:hypothetical protein [Actinomycetota bacterium]